MERPDALLPTVGGQTALNVTLALAERGVCERYGVELIGANIDSIKKAEDRDLFKQAMISIGLSVPKSGLASSIDEALAVLERISLPLIIRPAFTLGGTGGNIVYNREDFIDLVTRGLDESPISQVLLEESVIGWKEFELEVMRDRKDNVVIICSIENIDPMGIHTGDSITVAPQQTLTDREYQDLRNMSIKIIREIGVDTGGSNIQFAVNPRGRPGDDHRDEPAREPELRPGLQGDRVPHREDRGEARRRASPLTRYPTTSPGRRPASFEPTIDYVVVKAPRWAFEKFEGADSRLGTQMKSVGRGHGDRPDLQGGLPEGAPLPGDQPLRLRLRRRAQDHRDAEAAARAAQARHHREGARQHPRGPDVLPQRGLQDGLERGPGARSSPASTGGSWPSSQEIVDAAQEFAEECKTRACTAESVRRMKRLGFSDRQLGYLSHRDELVRLYERGPDSQKEYAKTLKAKEDEVRKFRYGARHRPRLQAGGHLRRRVRGVYALLLFIL